jgi:RNA polymerase sigma factor (sigma-70 family)
MGIQQEKEIIDGCIKGRREAQKLLYDHFAAKMLALCFRYCDSVEEAEDVLQEGFIKVFSHIAEFKGQGAFEGWVRRIMVNTALNYLKKIAAYRFNEDLDELPEGQQPGVPPSDTLEAGFLIGKIRELPAGYRAVFNLYEVEGYSHNEIGKMLGISPNTSKSQLQKAKRLLRQKLEPYQHQ